MHLPQRKLCTRKMGLALEVKFHLDLQFTDLLSCWWMLTNRSDVKCVFPRCRSNQYHSCLRVETHRASPSLAFALELCWRHVSSAGLEPVGPLPWWTDVTLFWETSFSFTSGASQPRPEDCKNSRRLSTEDSTMVSWSWPFSLRRAVSNKHSLSACAVSQRTNKVWSKADGFILLGERNITPWKRQ